MIKIYKASAGSGKTFTLAREYIIQILGVKREDGTYRLAKGQRDRHRKILAITFTNKATEEMKNRIIHELAVLAGREPGWTKKSDYQDDLVKLFSCSPDDLKVTAGQALDDLLHDFNYFNVSTIDAFFQMVLRTFAREAEIDGNYEVELDDKMVIALGVQELLGSLRNSKGKENAYLMSWLENYMADKVTEGGSFNIFNRSSQLHANLVKFFNDISNEVYHEHAEEIMAYLDDPERLMAFDRELAQRIGQVRSRISTACTESLSIIKERNIPESGVIQKNTIGLLNKWRTGRSDDKNLGTTIEKILASSDAAYVKSAVNSNYRDRKLDDSIVNACAEIKDGFESVKFYEFLRKNLFHLGLLKRLDECISRYRTENSTIMLSDTNAILQQIIKDDDTPFVYERIGQTLEHFLIDEFQDTSLLQWKNLRPLVNNSVTYGRDCLVIGDEKQCIYRFRNSEPSLLQNLHTDFLGWSESRGNTPSENTNWRSSREVVRFNNSLFTAIASASEVEELYNNVAQLVSVKHRDHAGYVKVHDFGAHDEDSDTLRSRMLDFMTAELKDALSSGYSPADIAVLVRTRKEGVAVITHLLERQSEGELQGIRIVSDQSLVVSQSPAVRLIVSVLRFLTSTDDITSSRKKSRRDLARLLNRYEFFLCRNLSASDALHDAIHSSELVEDIAEEALMVNCMNLSTVVERIIGRYIPTEERKRQNLFLCTFHDLVNSFSRNGSADIRSFLQWWDDKGHRTPVSGVADANSLSVLTIHKSKGLEFKVVIVPFAGAKDLTVKEVKWFEMPQMDGFDPDIVPPYIPVNCTAALKGTPFEMQFKEIERQVLIDELNVLYVAFTRAVDRLVVGLAKKNVECVADHVRRAIEKCDEDFAVSQSARVDVYSSFMPLKFDENSEIIIGEPTHPGDDHKSALTALSPSDDSEMPPYKGDDRDDLWDGTRVDDVSRYDMGVARQRGIIIHDLLARVKRIEDVPVALRKMIREGLVPPEDEAALKSGLEMLLSDPHAEEWFGCPLRVLIERPISGPKGELRPDRVVWTQGGTIDVIDYKTGKENPGRYERQVRRYVERLTETGLKNVRGFIWYLDTGEIVAC